MSHVAITDAAIGDRGGFANCRGFHVDERRLLLASNTAGRDGQMTSARENCGIDSCGRRRLCHHGLGISLAHDSDGRRRRSVGGTSRKMTWSFVDTAAVGVHEFHVVDRCRFLCCSLHLDAPPLEMRNVIFNRNNKIS